MARGPGKGVSNNPKGKPKGTKNKTSTELKEFYVELLSNNVERMQTALEALYLSSPKDYLMVMDKISNKVVANKKDITSDDKELGTTIVIKEITKK